MVSHLQKRDTVVFHDPQYPQACTYTTLHKIIPNPFDLTDAAHLAERLDGGCKMLLSFHGPYFPKAAWNAVLHFLERGGNIAIFGGMPFTRPVTEDGAVEPEQDTYTRQIYLGPFFQLPPPATPLQLVADDDAALLCGCSLDIPTDDASSFWSFYPRLTQVSDHPEEMGSAGPIDTVLQPLILALTRTASGDQRVATPALLLDQRAGRFRGGRWLISAWKPSSEEIWLTNAEAIQRLILLASEAISTFEVRPVLACYQPGEAPSLVAAAHSSSGLQAHITVYQPGGEAVLGTFDVDFPASPVLQEQVLQLLPQQEPGLYRIEAEYHSQDGQLLAQKSGFWLWDETLVEATHHKRLVAGRDHFYQGDQLFLIWGTTYMDSRVQRKFLHLPNPTRWDADMMEIKAAGINTIRTGIWTAWREIVPVAGVVNETFLRALDAFVMTICKHNLQLIFTFFSFFPPLFEGENPWLDPRSIEAQQAFLASLARRYARVELLSWDLINEPSFGDPQKIFAPRPLPHYDHFEITAFQQWLAKRYTLSELQFRWRQTPADLPDWAHVLPPREEDYTTYIRETKVYAALKVADYTRFSQDMFNQWATRMYEAIRASGSQTLIGVGQDESGARISPQFYAPALDYTTTHPWWNIDDLLWDMLLDKTPEKPNLIQETGVMLARDIDGRLWRSEQESAYLLERKLITGLLARSAGLIQWLWHINGYMTDDNENSIGLVRPDGSAKPELAVVEEFGRLMLALAGQLIEMPPPDVWVVIPYSQWFVRPDLARNGTRQAIRLLGNHLGIIPQMVSEYHLDTLLTALQRPHTVIIPALQLFDPQAWSTLLQYVKDGGTLLVSGVLARDPHNLPFDLNVDGMPEIFPPVAVSHYEELIDSSGRTCAITFTDDKISYVKKAHNHIYSYQHGKGLLLWCGLPLELSCEVPAIIELYQQAISHAGLQYSGRKAAISKTSPVGASVLVAWQPLKDGMLLLAVSESSSTQHIMLDGGTQITVDPNRAGALILRKDQAVQTFGGLHCNLGAAGAL
jgi:hypothetical protein